MFIKTHQAINLTIETRMFVITWQKAGFCFLWQGSGTKCRHDITTIPVIRPELQLQDYTGYRQLLTFLPSPFGRVEASVGLEVLLLDRPSLLGVLDTLREVLGGVDLSGGRPRRITCLACLSSSPSSLFYGEGEHKRSFFFSRFSKDKSHFSF